MPARTRIFIPLILALLAPFAAFAALININTATADELDALPGIGPSKAAAIVQYRTDHGPFASIADIQNVSGIGPSTYADIAPLITVGDVPAGGDSGGSATTTASSTPPASGSASSYVPPPSSLAADAGPDFAATLDMPIAFSARVKAGNSLDSSAQLFWSFGDGSSAEGNPAQKTYQFPGTYIVSVRVQDGTAETSDTVTVTVSAARVRFADVTSAGFTIANDSDLTLDLSGWRLSSGGSTFRFPEGTRILPQGSVLFPQMITDLPVAYDAVLTYPDGVVAARALPPQPEPLSTSSTSVQTVSSASATSLSVPPHVADAVSAPAPAPEAVAGAGAAFAASVTPEGDPEAPAGMGHGFLHSPWVYGALGVLTVAGAAFLIL